jgi:hypothetical protein
MTTTTTTKTTTALRSFGAELFAEHGALIATACLAAYYSLTASRDLSLYDSGELALAAVQLGLGHPPGQPLHTLLGYVLSRAIASAPLWGVCLVSALPAALTLLPAASIAQQLTPLQAQPITRRWAPWLLLLFALHESMWEPATRVEVYALANLCAVLAVAYALPLFAAESTRADVLRRTAGAGLLLGLCASSNPVIAAASGVALAPGILRAAARTRAFWATLGVAAVSGCSGLLPYLYLPLVAAHPDVLIWGGLHDTASYWRYLTLQDYQRNQVLGLFGMLEHAAAWFAWATEHLLLPVLIIGLGGFVAARARLRLGVSILAIAFALLLTMISFNVGWNLEVPDYNGYLALVYWLAAAGAAAMFVRCAAREQTVASAAVVLCMATSLFSPPSPLARTRSNDRLARALAEQVLHEAPAGAILVTFADYFAGSLFYLQEAEHKRRDVVVLAYGLSASSWHWRHLQSQHPELKPIDLTKRGGRLPRVQEWLRDNSERAVLVEHLRLAQLLGLRVCPGGLYMWTGKLCDAAANEVVPAAQLLADQLALVGAGSPGAAGAIAEVSEQLGSALWRLGRPGDAHALLMAGVPQSAWPARLADSQRLAAAKPLIAPPPQWARAVALGDPARNLFLAAALAAASGQAQAAHGYVEAAARLRLPEAQNLLTHQH